jgi:hypothetical protein
MISLFHIMYISIFHTCIRPSVHTPLNPTPFPEHPNQRLGAGPPALVNGNTPFAPVTGVCAPPTGVAGAGVGARDGTLLLLCAMCALTK